METLFDKLNHPPQSVVRKDNNARRANLGQTRASLETSIQRSGRSIREFCPQALALRKAADAAERKARLAEEACAKVRASREMAASDLSRTKSLMSHMGQKETFFNQTQRIEKKRATAEKQKTSLEKVRQRLEAYHAPDGVGFKKTQEAFRSGELPEFPLWEQRAVARLQG